MSVIEENGEWLWIIDTGDKKIESSVPYSTRKKAVNAGTKFARICRMKVHVRHKDDPDNN
jgi:hypothetical protein